MTTLGEELHTNAPALQFIPASCSAAVGVALNYLDELEGLDPLPPARLIDRSGSIHAPAI